MAILPLNLELQDAQGNALSGANCYICTQPATTSTIPPSPLATVYLNTGGSAGVNPIQTDGFGFAQPYVSGPGPYTIVFSHPLFLTPLVLVDQYPSGSSAGTSLTPVNASTQAGTITGAINGSNRVFVLPSVPIAGSLAFDSNGQVLTPNLGYTISGATVTVAVAFTPTAPDGFNANYLI